MKRLHVKVLFVIFLFFSFSRSSAQDINGKWYGIGNVNISSSSNSYLCELVLLQKGDKITGYFNYFFRDAYITNYVAGSFDKKTHLLLLNAIPILFYQTSNPGTGVDCRMCGAFTMITSQLESSLTGAFESDDFHKFTSPPIKVHFVKQTKEGPSLKEMVQPVLEIAEKPVLKTEDIALKQLNMRRIDLTRILDFTDDSVQVDMYDNGDFDYDTVTVFYNSKLVEYKQLLQIKTPISFHLALDSVSTNNDLVMFAENLGLIPPNSGLMVITDKTHRYEIPFESDYIKNAAVRLRKIPPPKYQPYKL